MTDWIERELQDAVRRVEEKKADEGGQTDSGKKMLDDTVKWANGELDKIAKHEAKREVRAPTVVAFKHPYVIVAAEDIEAGSAMRYGEWATWDSTIHRFVVPVYKVEE
jgi:hypothetical protein